MWSSNQSNRFNRSNQSNKSTKAFFFLAMLMTDLLSNEWLGLRFLNPADKKMTKSFLNMSSRRGRGSSVKEDFLNNVFLGASLNVCCNCSALLSCCFSSLKKEGFDFGPNHLKAWQESCVFRSPWISPQPEQNMYWTQAKLWPMSKKNNNQPTIQSFVW